MSILHTQFLEIFGFVVYNNDKLFSNIVLQQTPSTRNVLLSIVFPYVLLDNVLRTVHNGGIQQLRQVFSMVSGLSPRIFVALPSRGCLAHIWGLCFATSRDFVTSRDFDLPHLAIWTLFYHSQWLCSSQTVTLFCPMGTLFYHSQWLSFVTDGDFVLPNGDFVIPNGDFVLPQLVAFFCHRW